MEKNESMELVRKAQRDALIAEEMTDNSLPVDPTNLDQGEAESAAAKFQRNVLVIGCGGGGSNIASEIYLEDGKENTLTILYDTVEETIAGLHCDLPLHVPDEQGAGKDRDVSKDFFRSVVKGTLTDIADKVNEWGRPVHMAMIITTADGGTGSGASVIMARLLRDNLNIPVMIIGIYPSLKEDQMAYYNAVSWQSEVNAQGIPHIIVSNSLAGTSVTSAMHKIVNQRAVEAASLITGKGFGVAKGRQIDRCNLFRLTQDMGGRMVAVRSDRRPSVGQSLDDYLEQLLQESGQPAPMGAAGIGIWLKGPQDMIDSLDVEIPELLKRYKMAPLLRFEHMEPSEFISIGAIFTDCAEASEQLDFMRFKYDEYESMKIAKTAKVGDLKNSMANPMAKSRNRTTTTAYKPKQTDGELDLSAFDD